MQQLNALKTLKDESRLVGHAMGLCSWSGMVCSVSASRARSRYEVAFRCCHRESSPGVDSTLPIFLKTVNQTAECGLYACYGYFSEETKLEQD